MAGAAQIRRTADQQQLQALVWRAVVGDIYDCVVLSWSALYVQVLSLKSLHTCCDKPSGYTSHQVYLRLSQTCMECAAEFLAFGGCH
jgi:hypothetical protein